MDCRDETFIRERIPHRPPFLWLDRVMTISEDEIVAETLIREDLSLFQGHYPDYPLFPGVLLCEAVFQAGGVLLAEMDRLPDQDATVREQQAKPVLTRILGARFKREVHPGDTITITVKLKEQVGEAWFLKGVVRVRGRVAVQVEYACMVKEEATANT